MNKLKLLDAFLEVMDSKNETHRKIYGEFKKELYSDRTLKATFALEHHAELENVEFFKFNDEVFGATGNIINDSKGRFRNGEFIRTSAIQKLVFDENGNRYIVTFNTVYLIKDIEDKDA